MARAAKPVDLQSSKMGKAEKKKRKEAEEKLKGNKNLVYKAPTDLDKEEKKIYLFITKELKNADVLCNLDIEMIKITVDAIMRMNECKAIIKTHGAIMYGDNDNMYRNPATLIYKDYNAIYNKCCMELGLSVSSRAKLSTINIDAAATKEDPLLKILAGGK
ncbi:phage terminase small subunit P27 family [Clostridium gasigenes]|uniref:phage terminase small subunit P27 family n=1 Tax=Clostridium gasigenes TaxID=94869 RepID=UPI00143862B2|nr:phage terminase small subunit P27 family [Clostridium gasigenes]NKF05294.1 phage terminase small subunit P27 family [Clostridium gasigenes]QSW18749.1 phage terminase small subunit P27 family [Clostridium gasigenes]